MVTIFLILFSLHFVFSIIVFFTTLKEDGFSPPAEFPFVSVIIAARNEEKHIRACLISLKNQVFPKDKFEVIVVDDHSTDNTPQIIKGEISSQENFYYTSLSNHAFRKRNALIHGIKISKGEYIFQLDGDCVANKFWLSELCSHLENDYAIVGGYTLIRFKKKLLEKFQALEYLYLLSICKTLSSRTKVFSLFGNNTAFKKDNYLRTEGYKGIHNEILEDYQLVRIFQKDRTNKGLLIYNKNSWVHTEPTDGYKNYFQQRRRWGSGILEVKIVGKFIFFGFLILYTILAVYPFFSKIFYIFFLMRLVADFLIVFNSIRIFRQNRLILYFIFFHIHSILTTILAGMSLILSPTTKWKGRTVGQP